MRKLRTLLVWSFISVLLQVGFLYFLDHQLKSNVSAATEWKKPVVIQKAITLPEDHVENLQASYSKHYLAYTDYEGLKVYDVKAEKLVFSEDKPAGGDILSFKWLPDRNILLYITAKPNAVGNRAKVTPKPVSRSLGNFILPVNDPSGSTANSGQGSGAGTGGSSSANGTGSGGSGSSSGTGGNSGSINTGSGGTSGSGSGTAAGSGATGSTNNSGSGTGSSNSTGTSGVTIRGSYSTGTGTAQAGGSNSTSTPKPSTTPRGGTLTPSAPSAAYYNPQVTELYSVDFGADMEQGVTPDSRLERKIQDFPAGGVIQSMDFSTYTNLIYLKVKTQTAQILYEIDVMRNITKLQRSGEKITNISTSDKKGTLYIQSVLNGVHQIVSVKHTLREQLLNGSQYVLLGQEDEKVMVGVVVNNALTKVLSLPDTGLQEKTNKSVTVEWQGYIPWKDYSVVAGTGDFLVFYNSQGAVVLEGGKERTVKFTGQENYVTSEGREVMEVTPNANGTSRVEFKPL